MPNLAYLELKDLAGVSRIKKREKWHPVTSFHHKMEKPIDPLTLEPAKRQVHGLFVIQKEIDAGSHWWHHLHQTNKTLGLWKLHCFHMPPSGDEVNYLDYELVGARVVEVEMVLPSLTLQKNAIVKEYERISFQYDKLIVRELQVPPGAGLPGQGGSKSATHTVSGILTQNAVFHIDWIEEQKKASANRLYGELTKWIKGKLGNKATETKIYETISNIDLVELFKARWKKSSLPVPPAEPE